MIQDSGPAARPSAGAGALAGPWLAASAGCSPSAGCARRSWPKTADAQAHADTKTHARNRDALTVTCCWVRFAIETSLCEGQRGRGGKRTNRSEQAENCGEPAQRRSLRVAIMRRFGAALGGPQEQSEVECEIAR